MLCSGFAMQMASVAIGWQVYEIHHRAFDLGLIGLAEFLPVPLLALPAGQIADRLPRGRLVMIWGIADAGGMGLLLVVTIHGADQLWQFFALAVVTGTLAALGNPAGRSLVPELVPVEMLAGALALRSIAGQTATIAGPALGGLIFAIRPQAVYGLGLVLMLVSSALLLPVTPPPRATGGTRRPAHRGLLAGISFIRTTPILLGAITLDLFAVLFGGAVALLPLFAQSILHVGPFGLGILRSAVAVGALVAAIRLARRPLQGHAGQTLFLAVGVFGASMIVFGLSRWFWLSVLALGVSGFVDMFSMNIRSTTVALATPNHMRGRVNAVEGVFIGASNELGAFESGVAAALIGAVPAGLVGGAPPAGPAPCRRFVFPAPAHGARPADRPPR